MVCTDLMNKHFCLSLECVHIFCYGRGPCLSLNRKNRPKIEKTKNKKTHFQKWILFPGKIIVGRIANFWPKLRTRALLKSFYFNLFVYFQEVKNTNFDFFYCVGTFFLSPDLFYFKDNKKRRPLNHVTRRRWRFLTYE